MTRSVRALSAANLIAIHAQTRVTTGWSATPVRDEDALDDAIARMQHAGSQYSSGLMLQAATLASAIARGQPFLDGNLPTAYMAMLVLLDANGYGIDAPPVEIARRLRDAVNPRASSDSAVQDFAGWLRERVTLADRDVTDG